MQTPAITYSKLTIETLEQDVKYVKLVSLLLTLNILHTLCKIFLYSTLNILHTLCKIFLYSAYAYDTTFFLSDEDSVIEVTNTFHKFSLVSGLKPTEAKCEIAVLKGVSLALCGMDFIDLTKKR